MLKCHHCGSEQDQLKSYTVRNEQGILESRALCDVCLEKAKRNEK
jgi:hypothetical protein